MAVYQGARKPSGFALPWAVPGRGVGLPGSGPRPATEAGATRSRRAASRSRAAVRSRLGGQRRLPMVLAGIVVAFSVGFISLSQSLAVAATSYDIVRLQSEHDRLVALQQELQSDVSRLQGEPAIRKEALDAGLGQLGAAIVIPAR